MPRRPKLQPDPGFRSGCPIASSLDLVGDRWTLVVLRDLINGKRRFKELLESPERIASNVLASRLSAMEQDGLVTASVYQERPRRLEYRLTRKGAELLPVLQAFCRWGEANLSERWTAPESFMAMRPEEALQRR